MKRKAAKKKMKKDAAGKSSSPLVPFDEINALVDFLEARSLEEFELERSGLRIRIKRQGIPAAPAPAMAAQPPPNPAPAAAPADAGPPADDLGPDVHLIKSPIVGTYYSSLRPDAPPFVQAGDQVSVGQVLCIVEAMKLMNEIESDVAGEVVKIFGANAQPVEYGEPLFAIRPA